MAETFDLDSKTEAVLKKKGYQLKKRLSAGAFGQVYTALCRDDGLLYAVKIMELDKVSEKFKQKFLPRELAALMAIKHENVIRVYDIIKSGGRIYIFMEFAPNGDIAAYLKKNGTLTESHACLWFTQSTQALRYVHEEVFMAHRDIKVDNILLDENNTCKLTDFGFAKIVVDERTQRVQLSESYCGTEPYYCPQIVKRIPYNPFGADIWAMGVVLFAMLNNKFPFHFGDAKLMLREQTDRNHMKTRYVKEFSREYRELQQAIFEPDERRRPSAAECLEFTWVVKKGKIRK